MTQQRQVTERDLRAPQFRDGDLSDYEFRDDGSIARKDRWELGLRNIATIVGKSRKEWEVQEIVDDVRKMRAKLERATDWVDRIHTACTDARPKQALGELIYGLLCFLKEQPMEDGE